jgi:glycosyltransferase involved in cell wall biosynthesis
VGIYHVDSLNRFRAKVSPIVRQLRADSEPNRYEDERRARPERLNVLHLNDALGEDGGGAERVARDLLINLDPDRFTRTLCVTRWSGADRPGHREALDELDDAGVEFIGLKRRSRAQLRPWSPLIQVLRERPIHILHSHKFGSNFWGATLGSYAHTPVVIAHEHTWSYEGRPFRKLIDREVVARGADVFLAVSNEDRRRMIEIERIDPDKILLLPNGIDPGPPDRPATEIRAELGIRPDQPLVGTVCVMRPQKALEVLLDAFAIVHERFPDAVALLVGEGPERERLEAHARELGIASAVRFAGARTDVANVLPAFDVWVSSSDYEGSSLAILEAMEAEVPIVATNVGGTPDLIEDGRDGLLVPPREPAQLAAAITKVLGDPALAASLAAAARSRRRSEFDMQAVAAQVAELYEGLYARAVSSSD